MRRAEPDTLVARFGAELSRLHIESDARLLVACSGGVDSVVLLHLLRFLPEPARRDLQVAHFDHAMRPESDADAEWVQGLGRAWDLPVHTARAQSSPRNEAEARSLRYDFLERLRQGLGVHHVLLAHHADDQAETVLFRVLRGTGLTGLAGIPSQRQPHLVRPLLPFWREEITEYAQGARLAFRSDSTNQDPRQARALLRHHVLPLLERSVAPGARRSLVRLADLARANEDAWAEPAAHAHQLALVREEANAVEWNAAALAELHPSLAARVLRRGAAGLGVVLDEESTRRVLGAIAETRVRTELRGGLEVIRRRHLIGLSLRSQEASEDQPVRVEDYAEGEASLRLGGRTWRVRWSHRRSVLAEESQRLLGPLQFPLLLRARRPGDRIRLPGGTKKLKKVFQEAGLSRQEKATRPLVVDAQGQVLWAVGLGVAASRTAPDEPFIHLGFERADRR